MRTLSLFFALLLALPSLAADYAREKKWAEEVLPAVLTGDPVWLELGNGHKFLSLYTEAAKPKAGVIIVHGTGVHPDWGLIAPLRQRLPDMGYATLSVQMPVLGAEAKAEEYAPTFGEAEERIRLAIAFMKSKGYEKIALISHSMGYSMAARFAEANSNADLAAWVAIGATAMIDFAKLRIPMMDMIGENDFPRVLEAAKIRARTLPPGGKSTQVVAPKADHFFEGRDDQLVGLVREFLDKSL